jgi:hypothetical protein
MKNKKIPGLFPSPGKFSRRENGRHCGTVEGRNQKVPGSNPSVVKHLRKDRELGAYYQHLIFFITYECAQ